MIRRLIIIGLVTAFVAPQFLAQERRKPQDVESIIRGLEQGMIALDKMGGQSRLIKALREQAQRVKKEFAHGEDTHGRTQQRAAQGAQARRVAAFKRQLQVKVWAAEAIATTGNKKGAELMRNAVRADKIRLERRRDEEARKAYESAPDRGAQIELLNWASKIWAEKGDKKRSQACAEVAASYKQRRDRERESANNREREHRRRDQDAEERARIAAERAKALQRAEDRKKAIGLQRDLDEKDRQRTVARDRARQRTAERDRAVAREDRDRARQLATDRERRPDAFPALRQRIEKLEERVKRLERAIERMGSRRRSGGGEAIERGTSN